MKDKIVEELKDVYKAKSVIEINDMLGLKSVEDLEELQDSLRDLVSLGIVHETKKGDFILIENCKTLTVGSISINKNGDGFLLRRNEPDIFVAQNQLNGAINGDYVEVDVVNNEGQVIRILKRDLKNIVGEIVSTKKGLAFKPDDEKLTINIELTKDSLKGCVEGHKVLINIVKELGNKRYLAEVKKVIGHKNDPGVDIISIALRHGIEIDFSPSTIKELESIPDTVNEKELNNRKDLTKEMIFTIDGDDTKDIDDAISIEKKEGLFELGVHIADVSNYVKVGSALYEDAYVRGTSSYLADTVIPMIPHQLSNGICSLNEGVIRLTISCVMDIDYKGHIIDYDIFPSYIKSNKKMTYKCVNKILEENEVPEGYEPFVDTLKTMQELASILRKEKISRGYITFDIDEAKIIQDENGKCIDVIKRYRGIGENLIEDFMIAANETVAKLISNMDLPFIYRVHDIPNSDKIDEFVNLVKQLGYSIKTNLSKITPVTMRDLLEELKDKKEYPILSSMLLRSMKKAVYSTNNIGHFGLGSTNYTHFTSPIRRFPDLTVHRLLRTYLFENNLD
ncbi:MAG: ribonuclease R, partial [Bacilli bacterium]|nr:ribonuclease R [Bacilli bacterium]